MSNFNIIADNFAWITGSADDPGDKCLHGHVTVTIGDDPRYAELRERLAALIISPDDK